MLVQIFQMRKILNPALESRSVEFAARWSNKCEFLPSLGTRGDGLLSTKCVCVCVRCENDESGSRTRSPFILSLADDEAPSIHLACQRGSASRRTIYPDTSNFSARENVKSQLFCGDSRQFVSAGMRREGERSERALLRTWRCSSTPFLFRK
jgi:hypothetical protein